ncbi:hypothetical protein M569_11928, partial [Genlisea aurea]
MPKRGKKRNDEEALSDGCEPPMKSSKSGNYSEDADGILVCELSKNRKVSVRAWKGKIMVDIREFYNSGGNEAPSKKGISLSLDQWKILRDHADEIDEELS